MPSSEIGLMIKRYLKEDSLEIHFMIRYITQSSEFIYLFLDMPMPLQYY